MSGKKCIKTNTKKPYEKWNYNNDNKKFGRYLKMCSQVFSEEFVKIQTYQMKMHIGKDRQTDKKAKVAC